MKIFGIKINILPPRPRWTEKRRAPRFPVHETLYLDYHNLLQRRKGVAEGKDISILGLRFACESQFEKGTPLDFILRFHPESGIGEPLRLRAHVVHCYRKSRQRRYRVGCEFEEPDTFSQNQIQSFISWLKERDSGFALHR